MTYFLMNKDRPALAFDFDKAFLRVIDDRLLPYAMKDFIRDASEADDPTALRGGTAVLRSWLMNRVLLLSRPNAKAILRSAGLPESPSTDGLVRISLSLHALSMTDNFYVLQEDEELPFEAVCLRRHFSSGHSFKVCILGKPISASPETMAADLLAGGSFPKFWKKNENNIELWKTDRLKGTVNSACEVECSHLLDLISFPHVAYRKEQIGDFTFSVCSCMCDDDHSLIPMGELLDWRTHTGKAFPKDIQAQFDRFFPNMCCIDYLLANADRNQENWGMIADSENNILGFAPLYDFNLALVSDLATRSGHKVHIDDQIYEPTGVTYAETVRKYAPMATIDLSRMDEFPEGVRGRAEVIKNLKNL